MPLYEVSLDREIIAVAEENLLEAFNAQDTHPLDTPSDTDERLLEYGLVLGSLAGIAQHESEYGRAGASDYMVRALNDRATSLIVRAMCVSDPDKNPFPLLHSETQMLQLAAVALRDSSIVVLSDEAHKTLALIDLSVEEGDPFPEAAKIVPGDFDKYPSIIDLEKRSLIRVKSLGDNWYVSILRQDRVDRALKNKVARNSLEAEQHVTVN